MPLNQARKGAFLIGKKIRLLSAFRRSQAANARDPRSNDEGFGPTKCPLGVSPARVRVLNDPAKIDQETRSEPRLRNDRGDSRLRQLRMTRARCADGFSL
jgi:hypothetical protein